MSVVETLRRMVGVWQERIETFDLAGRPLTEDTASGTPGPSPFENLVYVDFDGARYTQTNVTYRGRPPHVRTFTGRIEGEVLLFDALGPSDPGHVGVSGGPGVIIFAPRALTPAWSRYLEPDVVRLVGDLERTRTTLLYRDGVAVRSLAARGVKLTEATDRRVSLDPRGEEGEVHGQRSATRVFA
jgi:hypothetical protein